MAKSGNLNRLLRTSSLVFVSLAAAVALLVVLPSSRAGAASAPTAPASGVSAMGAAEWGDVAPSGWATSSAVTCAAAVTDTDGLQATTAQFRYSVDGGGTWYAWQSVWPNVTGDLDTTKRMTVPNVYMPDSATQNLMMFQILDATAAMETSPVFVVPVDSTAPTSAVTTSGWVRSVIGVSGTASDATSGVARVDVRIRRVSDGLYWNGFSWQVASMWLTATGTESWSLPFSPGDSGPFTAESRAVDAAGLEQSTLGSGTFTVDAQPPSSVVGTSGYRQGVSWSGFITGTASDGESGVADVQITIQRADNNQYYNGVDWQPTFVWLSTGMTTGWAYPFAPGSGIWYTVNSRAVDAAGNVQSPPAAAGFLLDSALPTSEVGVSGYVGLGWTNRITGTAQDLDSGVAYVDLLVQRTSYDNWYYNGAWWQPGPVWLRTVGTAAWYLDFSPDLGQTYLLQSRATDLAGNQQTSYGVSTFAYDGLRPTSVASTSGLVGRVAYSGAISGVASDDLSGVAVTELTIRRELDLLYYTGATWAISPTWLTAVGTTSWTVAFTPTEGLTYTIESRATDRAGNQQLPLYAGQFQYDGTDPTATVSQSGFYGPIAWTGAFTGTATDASSGVNRVQISIQRAPDHMYWSGATWGATQVWVVANGADTWSFPFAPQDAMTYTLSARAVDNAGNTQTIPVSSTITYDSKAPLSTIEMADYYRPATWTGVISGTASDGGSGLSRVEVSVRRLNDNYYYDGTSWVTTTAWLTTTGTVTWTYPLTPTDGLSYAVWSRAVDMAGNVQSLYASTSFVFDAGLPESLVGTHGYYRLASWTGAITGTAADAISGVDQVAILLRRTNDGFYWTGSGWQTTPQWVTATGSAEWSYGFVPTSGVSYTVQSRALDRAGNVQSSVNEATFGYDTSEPASAIGTSGALSPATWTGSVTGTASAGVSGVATVEMTIQRSTDAQYYNGSGWQGAPVWLPAVGGTAWSYPFVPTDGVTYTVRSRAQDGAGNMQSMLGQSLFVYDATPPVAVLGTTRAFRSSTWTGVITGTTADATTGVQSVAIALQRSTDGLYFNGTSWGGGLTWLTPVGIEAWIYSFAPTVDGVYTVQVRALDRAGNTQTPPASGTFVYDNAAPYAPTDPEYYAGWRNVNSFAVSWENIPDISGFAGAWYNVNPPGSPTDGTFVATTDTITNAVVPGEGIWDLHLWMQDGAGNVSQNRRLVRTGVFMLDMTPPTTSYFVAGPLGSGGWYRGPFTVTLSAEDQLSLSGLLSTLHRVDGGDYASGGRFVVSGEGVRQIEYYSTDRAGNVEATHSVTVGIDSVAPSASISVAGPAGQNGWFTGPLSVTLSGTDATSGIDELSGYRWRLDGDTWQQGKTFVVAGQGTYTLWAVAIDRAGNSGTPISRTISIDSLAPSAALALDGASGNNGWYRSAVTVTVNVADGISGPQPGETYYRVDGGPWIKNGVFAVSTQGDHTVEFYGIDRAGNQGAAVSQHVKIDTVPPLGPLGMTSAPTGWTNVNSFSLSWTAPADTSGIAGAWYKLNVEPGSNQDGAFVAGATGISGIAMPGDGVHSVAVWLQDQAGNVDYHNRVARLSTFFYDSTPPSSSAVVAGTTGDNGWTVSAATVTVSSQDQAGMSGLAAISLRVDSSDWITSTGTSMEQVSITTSGKHIVSFRGKDAAGNLEPVQQTVVRVDLDAPGAPRQVQVSPAGWANTDRFVVTWADPVPPDVSGIAGAYYRLGTPPSSPTDGTFVSAPFGTLTITVAADGQSTLYLWLRDVAGNADHLQRVELAPGIRRDRTAPVTGIALSGTLGTNNWFVTPVGVTLTPTDGLGSGVASTQYRLDGGSWVSGTATTVVTDGLHTLEYGATDVAGNVEVTRSSSWKSDTRAPASTTSLSGTLGSGGWYVTPVTVTLSSADQEGLSGLAALGYRVDSGAWVTITESSVRIPLTVSGAHTISYRGRDGAGNVETLRQVAAKVDREAPVTTLGITGTLGANGWYITPVTVTLAAADGSGSGVAAIRYRLDGSGWVTGTLVPIPADGARTIEYASSDVAGNAEDARMLALKIDARTPSTQASLAGRLGGGGWYVSPVTVTLTSQDQAGLSGVTALSYRVDGSGWITLSEASVATVLVTSSGSHVVQYRARDGAGNLEAIRQQTVPVDVEPPTTTPALGGTLGGDSWYVSPVTVTLSAGDGSGSGVAGTRYRVDGGAWITGTVAMVTSDGLHTVEYASTDVAGNTEIAKSVGVKKDSQPPTTLATVSGSSGSNGWYVSAATVRLASTDQAGLSGVSAVAYRVDGGSWITTTGASAEVLVSTSGQHTVEYRGFDTAGNGESIRQISVPVDLIPPSTTHTLNGTMGAGSWYVTPVIVRLSITDAGGSGPGDTRYRVDGGAWTTGLVITVTSGGSHKVDYISADAAGNIESVHSVSFKLDASAPTSQAVIAGTAGTSGWYTSPATVTVSSADQPGLSGLVALGYRVDLSSWVTVTSSASVYIPILTAGDHTVSYRGLDAAGNLEATRQTAVRIDMDAPTTTHAATGTMGSGGWYISTVTLRFSATDGVGSGVSATRYRIDSGAWLTGTVVAVGADGAHVVEYGSVDVAGNAETPHTVSVRKDAQAPTTTAQVVGTSGSAGWYSSPVTVTVSSDDQAGRSGLASLTYRVDSGAWITLTSAPSVDIRLSASGSHKIEFSGRDVAGNVEATQSLTVRIDLEPPTSSHTLAGTAGNDSWYVTPVTVTLRATDTGGSGLAGTRYRIDGGSWVTGTVIVVGADGVHTIDYAAVDGAGNVEVAHSIGLREDQRAPTVAVFGPISSLGGSFSVTWVGNDFDGGSGISRFDVQVADGFSGAWQDWMVNTSSTGGSYSGQSGHLYLFRARARDAAGNQGAYPGSSQLLVQVSPFVNAGFETGNFSGWALGCDGLLSRTVVMADTHRGTQGWVAMLGDPSYAGDMYDYTDDNVPIGAACVSQTFVVPTASEHPAPALSFWYSIYTYDVVISKIDGRLYDSFDVTIQPQGGGSVLALRDGNYGEQPPLTDPLVKLGWKRGLVDLRPYAGQTITVIFANHNRNDEDFDTWTLLDDVTLSLMPVNRWFLPLTELRAIESASVQAVGESQPAATPVAPVSPEATDSERPRR